MNLLLLLNSSILGEKTMQSFSYKFLNAINPQVDYFDASKGFKMILLSEVQTDSLKTVSDKAFEF